MNDSSDSRATRRCGAEVGVTRNRLGRSSRTTGALRSTGARSIIIAGLALLVAGTGVAVAAVPDSDGTVSGCYSTKTGILRVLDAEAGQSCNANESALGLAAVDKLGKVANADRLDGRDAQSFLGHGLAYQNTAEPVKLPPGGIIGPEEPGEWITINALDIVTEGPGGALKFDTTLVTKNVGKTDGRIELRIVHNGHAHPLPSAGIIGPERDAMSTVSFSCDLKPGVQQVELQARAAGGDLVVGERSFSTLATHKLPTA